MQPVHDVDPVPVDPVHRDLNQPEPASDAAGWRRRLRGPRPLRRLAAVVLSLSVLLLGFAGLAYERVDRVAFTAPGSPPGGRTYLLLGSDSRAAMRSADDRRRYGGPAQTPGERADVVLALRIPDRGAPQLLEISRDLLVVGSQGGLIRLATTLAQGPQGVADSLCRSIGLGVDHLVVLHLEGLRAIVNAIGGVAVHSPAPARDRESGLTLRAGDSVLDGDGALAYVGSRRLEYQRDGTWVEDPQVGPDRAGRAAEVLSKVGRAAAPTLSHPLRSLRVMWTVSGSITVDDSLGAADALAVESALGELDLSRPRVLPIVRRSGNVDLDEVGAGYAATLRQFENAERSAPACERAALSGA